MYSEIAIPRQAYNTEEHQMLQQALDDFIKKEALPYYEAWEKNKMVVDECLQLHGGYGFIWEYDVARSFAAARVTRIYGGTSEIMKLIISRALFSDFYKKNLAKKKLVTSN